MTCIFRVSNQLANCRNVADLVVPLVILAYYFRFHEIDDAILIDFYF